MKIIAHRGATAERPGNTLGAFERALEIGVDAIEADVLITKDRRIVVRHDDLVQQGGRWQYVRELTLGELQQIDVGQGERIPSLEQLFDRFVGRCPVVLDIKDVGIAEPLAAVLKGHRGFDGVQVTSFLHSEIVDIGRRLPEVSRSITLAAVPVNFEGLLRDTNTKAVALFRGYLSEPVSRRLREMGVAIQVYPVNLLQEASVFASWGVEAIYTDNPGVMQPLRGR